jgi:hypothetical protein
MLMWRYWVLAVATMPIEMLVYKTAPAAQMILFFMTSSSSVLGERSDAVHSAAHLP